MATAHQDNRLAQNSFAHKKGRSFRNRVVLMSNCEHHIDRISPLDYLDNVPTETLAYRLDCSPATGTGPAAQDLRRPYPPS